MNNLELSLALATAPTSAFTELRERPRFWFPLLVLVVSTVIVIYWYYSIVDIDWLKETLYGNNPDFLKLPEAQRESAMAFVTRTTLLWGSLVAAALALPVVLLLTALYYLVAAKVTKLPLGYRHWLAFASWTALPALISTVASAIFLILADSTQLSPSVLQPLSINSLVLHRPIGSPGYSLFEALAIPAFLSWALMVIGVHVWSRRSWVFSAVFALLPSVVIFSVWAFFAFR